MGRRTERRMVPSLESPALAVGGMAVAVSDVTTEDVWEGVVLEVEVDDVTEVDEGLGDVICVRDREELVDTREEGDEVLEALLLVLAGLVEPPYVHPSPSGIDGP